MHELWTTVVGPLFVALAPEVVALAVGPRDSLGDAVRDATRRDGATLVECQGGETPAEAELVVVGAGGAEGHVTVLGEPVVVCHPMVLVPPRPNGPCVEFRVIGFGGCTIIIPVARAEGALAQMIDALRVSPLMEGHIEALEKARGIMGDPLASDLADARLVALTERLSRQSAELAELKVQVTLEDSAAAPETEGVEAAPVDEVRALEIAAEERFAGVYIPETLLAALGWVGPSTDLALPLPVDTENQLRARGQAVRGVSVAVGDEVETWLSIRSALEAAREPICVTLLGSDRRSAAVRRLLEAEPLLSISAESPSGYLVLKAGESVRDAWVGDDVLAGSIGYVLPGFPVGGSGGSHSVVQEVRALNRIGQDVVIHVPAASMTAVAVVYPESAAVFRPYGSDADLENELAHHDLVVATEYTSVGSVVAATRRHGTRAAYYVQDYEPLFNPRGSVRADGAILSYRADSRVRLFAKTYWLCNLVSARHQTTVAKVPPSLDEAVFHRAGRLNAGSGDRVRVAAMIRPRTPRRRPAMTAAVLAALSDEGPKDVEVVSFGCDAAELKKLGTATANFEHHGVLSRREVGELLRGIDIFVDLSVYQAFGRTGLEAMACGVVPVLPAIGGVAEYATHGHDALLVDGGDPELVVRELIALVGDRERIGRMSDAGAASAGRFSLDRAARALVGCFAGVVAA